MTQALRVALFLVELPFAVLAVAITVAPVGMALLGLGILILMVGPRP